MDDLMNKVGALIEEHVEGEVEARGLIKARNDTERLKGALRVQAQHSDLVSSTLETVRDILGAPPGAEFATDAARRVVKERDGLKAERSKRTQERDDACAAKDQAIRDLQAMREKVQALELKLLEVLRVVAAPQPADGSSGEGHPAALKTEEVDGFRVGDLVSAYGFPAEPIARFCQGFAQLDKQGLSLATVHLTRKPVEPGDRVRVTGELCGGSPFAGRIGTARAKELGGLYGEWRIDYAGSHFATCSKLVVAIAP